MDGWNTFKHDWTQTLAFFAQIFDCNLISAAKRGHSRNPAARACDVAELNFPSGTISFRFVMESVTRCGRFRRTSPSSATTHAATVPPVPEVVPVITKAIHSWKLLLELWNHLDPGWRIRCDPFRKTLNQLGSMSREFDRQAINLVHGSTWCKT